MLKRIGEGLMLLLILSALIGVVLIAAENHLALVAMGRMR
jgi:hypothetical protein